jgi:phosphatidylinositol phosphate synthase
MVISYERARAEALGMNARGGLMERAERFVFLSFGLAFGILVPVLWVMLVLTSFTAADRFRRVYQQADRPQRPHPTFRRTRDSESAEPRPALREWWAARRVDGAARRGHRSTRRSPRP